MSTPPIVVTASGPADLLRLVPALTGVPTEDSLVLVLFRGRRTAGAFRADLPHTRDPLILKRWASTIVGMACKADGVSAIVPVACTPETFAPSGRMPAAEVLRIVTRRARQAGLDVRDALCVAADGWGSLHDPALPRGGRPLEEVRPTALPESGDRVRPEVVDPAPASEAVQDRFAGHLAAWWSFAAGPGGVLHGVDLAAPGGATRSPRRAAMERYRFGEDQEHVVELLERALDEHDDAGDDCCACRALVYALLRRPGLPSVVLVQFAFGRRTGAAIWAGMHRGEHDSPEAELLGRAFGGDHRRPDADRLDRAIRLLLAIAALVPPGLRAPVDGALAWLHWARGTGSVAVQYAERALVHDPQHDVARIVLGWASAGRLPEWAFREDPTDDPLAIPA